MARGRERKRIIVIGGGTGVFTVLTGLKDAGHRLGAIVTMADDGGSSGTLREEFGILPPGDVRRALVALSRAPKTLADLFTYRFSEGSGLSGHSVGNVLLAALERVTGSFEGAIAAAGEILSIDGEVIPVTLDDIRLEAQLESGDVIRGEHAIDVPAGRPLARIVRLVLVPPARPNPKALDAIRRAHIIVIGPGDIYTSILPNLLVDGIGDAIRRSRGKKIYVVNLMTKRGETDRFVARDFVDAIEAELGGGVLDAVLVNRERPPRALAAWYYAREGAEPVRWSSQMFRGVSYRVVRRALLRREGDLIRHDARKLARALLALL